MNAKTDNYAEFYVEIRTAVAELVDHMESERYNEAIVLLEKVLTNSRLLYVWTKDKVQNGNSVELQRAEDV